MANRSNIEEHARKDAEETRIQGLKKKVYESAMTQTNFRLDPDTKDALANHFKERGLSMGSGIRMIIMDYVKMNGVEL